MINLDFNATTPLDPAVAAEMRPFLETSLSGGNPSSAHALGVSSKKAVENARKQVATLLNCTTSEIVFTSGGSESNSMAIQGAFYALKKKGNHIITSSIEHPAVLNACKFLVDHHQARLTVLDVDGEGRISLDSLRAAISPDTILITIMHANNEVGTLQPIPEIAAIAKEHGILFHSDGAQAVGKVPSDVRALGVDLYTVVSHKLFGPKGIGCLFIRAGVSLVPIICGASHESDRRAGTENVLAIVGFGKACELCARNSAAYAATMRATRDRLLDGLRQRLPPSALRVHSALAHCLPNTLSVGFRGTEASAILSEIGDRVACSAGAACHAEGITVSSVLTAMKVPMEFAMGTLRFSTGRYTTAQEIDQALPILTGVIERLLPKDGNAPADTQASEMVDISQVKLTKFTHGLGCACKLRPQLLEKIVGNLPKWNDPRVLVGTETGDDAAVYKLNDETALVLTTDFFTPIVDDPFHFGAISAANSISDVYAMGGTPVCALNIVAFPSARLPIQVLEAIMRGASAKAAEAGCPIVGGHTVDDTEPKFGLAVTGVVHPSRFVSNAGARPGDILVLTKPIGLGIASTAMKRGLADPTLVQHAIRVMETLNKGACEAMMAVGVNSATDVTGFGLLGHLMGMTVGSNVTCEVYASRVPIIPGVEPLIAAGCVPGGTLGNIDHVAKHVVWDDSISQVTKTLLCDAQTSGGLLISCPEAHLPSLLDRLRQRHSPLTESLPPGMPTPDTPFPSAPSTARKDVLCCEVIGRIVGEGAGTIRVIPAPPQ